MYYALTISKRTFIQRQLSINGLLVKIIVIQLVRRVFFSFGENA